MVQILSEPQEDGFLSVSERRIAFGLNMPPSITHPIMTLPNESTTIKSDAPRSFI